MACLSDTIQMEGTIMTPQMASVINISPPDAEIETKTMARKHGAGKHITP